MIPDLRTEFQVSELQRQEKMAAVARFRAAQGAESRGSNERASAALRQRIGVALVRVGQRLQGARPVEPVGSAGTLAITASTR